MTLDPDLAAAAAAAGLTADDLTAAAGAIRDETRARLRAAYRGLGVDLPEADLLCDEEIGPWGIRAGLGAVDGTTHVALLIPGVPLLPLTSAEARHLADRLRTLAESIS